MSLTPKQRHGQVHKKIKADHHRRNKNYLKTYWPYIPIIGIIGLGVLINHYWSITQTPQTGMALSSYSSFTIIEYFIYISALIIFLLRHAFAWHKVFVKGEVFATKHPMLDVLLVAIATFGLLLAHHGISLI